MGFRDLGWLFLWLVGTDLAKDLIAFGAVVSSALLTYVLAGRREAPSRRLIQIIRALRGQER